MKILKVRFENLNSLQEEIEIDFLKYENSIFTIIGETGAGKTTILDAICVALYAQTPRLQKGIQDLMSKNKGSAFSEVTFKVKNDIYVAYWSIKKAHKKVDGNFQQDIMSISKNGKILESAKTKVLKKIVEITNLEFNNFTKSLLLAQGEFDSFLKAKDKDRSFILEKMTGTEIYGEISKRVFEKNKIISQEIKELEKQKELLELLSDEDIENHKEKIKEISDELLLINKKIKVLEDKNRVGEELLRSENNSENISKYIENSTNKLKIFKRDFNFHSEDYKNIVNKNIKEKKKISKALKLDVEILGLQKEIKEIEKEIDKSNTLLLNEKKKDKYSNIKLLSLIEKKNNNNIFLKKNIVIADVSRNYVLIKNIILNIKNEKLKLSKYKYDKNLNLDKIESEIKTLESDIKILDNNIEKLFKLNLDKEFQYIKLLIDDINSYNLLKKNIKEIDEELFYLKNDLKTAKKDKEEKNSLLKITEENLELLHDKKNMVIQIRKYEDDLKKLKKGEACFLCGSKEHPYKKNYPKLDLDIDKKIKEKKNEIKDITLIKENLDKKYTILYESIKIMKISKENYLKEIKKCLNKEIDIKNNSLDSLDVKKEKLISQIEELDSLKIKKDKKSTTLIVKHKEKDIIKEIYNIKNNLKTLNSDLSKQLINLDLDINNIIFIENYLEKKIKKYNKIIEDEKLLTEEISKTKNDINLIKNNIDIFQKELNTKNSKNSEYQENVLSLRKNRYEIIEKENLDKYQKELDKIEKNKKEILDKDNHNILKIENFIVLKNKELNYIIKEISSLKIELDEISEKYNSLEITDSIITFRNKNNLLNRDIGKINEKLSDNKIKIKKNQKLINKIDSLEEKAKYWSTLNSYIGSKDGKKFKKYALSLTLGHLCVLANKHLIKLNDRYRLEPQKTGSLSLNVIDKYHASITRSISTLSGGESFLVSLALSLGLSDFASNKIGIKSIFLDEGFGSLDDKNLDMVISTLETLQMDGKIIGIISHVESLKSRISNQIKVIKNGDGSSRVVY